MRKELMPFGRIFFLATLVGLTVMVHASTDVWVPHVTVVGGWQTRISAYYSGTGSPASFTVTKYSDSGIATGTPIAAQAPAAGWETVQDSDLDYEGSARIQSSKNLLVKVSYRFGGSQSLCEFYLSGNTGTEWVMPNSVQNWFSYTGLAIVNPTGAIIMVTLEAWNQGSKVGETQTALSSCSRYVRLSESIWSGLPYDSFDTVVIRSSSAIPAPISITGNTAGDRHVFFTAQTRPINFSAGYAAGDLVATDPIVGNLRFIPAGTFLQGTPVGEPCRDTDEDQFTHTLTRNILVMETEITRQMWADLRTSQCSLPADPTNTTVGSGLSNPVQSVNWLKCILFANLLSVQSGLTRCYYKDAVFTVPVDASNYSVDPIYCNWNANGYRLPMEGEWEYFCRAGTTGTFWISEPNFSDSNCGTIPAPGTFPQLETIAWFKANSGGTSRPVGTKPANPWNLMDVNGNVAEWCWDWYSDNPTGPQINYTGAESSTTAVFRGGAWNYLASYCRSGHRTKEDHNDIDRNVGFRLVRTQE